MERYIFLELKLVDDNNLLVVWIFGTETSSLKLIRATKPFASFLSVINIITKKVNDQKHILQHTELNLMLHLYNLTTPVKFWYCFIVPEYPLRTLEKLK